MTREEEKKKRRRRTRNKRNIPEKTEEKTRKPCLPLPPRLNLPLSTEDFAGFSLPTMHRSRHTCTPQILHHDKRKKKELKITDENNGKRQKQSYFDPASQLTTSHWGLRGRRHPPPPEKLKTPSWQKKERKKEINRKIQTYTTEEKYKKHSILLFPRVSINHILLRTSRGSRVVIVTHNAPASKF